MNARIVVPRLPILTVHKNKKPKRKSAEVFAVNVYDPRVVKALASAAGQFEKQKTDPADQIDRQSPGELVKIKEKLRPSLVCQRLGFAVAMGIFTLFCHVTHFQILSYLYSIILQIIQQLKPYGADIPALARMALRLWTGCEQPEVEHDIAERFGTGEAFFIAEADGAPVGFAEVSLRHDYVEGSETNPVGYLEGVFVEEAYRRRGIAFSLLKAC